VCWLGRYILTFHLVVSSTLFTNIAVKRRDYVRASLVQANVQKILSRWYRCCAVRKACELQQNPVKDADGKSRIPLWAAIRNSSTVKRVPEPPSGLFKGAMSCFSRIMASAGTAERQVWHALWHPKRAILCLFLLSSNEDGKRTTTWASVRLRRKSSHQHRLVSGVHLSIACNVIRG